MKYFNPSYWFKLWVLSAPLFNSKSEGINAMSIDNQNIKDWVSNNTSLESINQEINYTNSSTNYQPYNLNQVTNQNINPIYQTELETSTHKHRHEKSRNRHKRQYNANIMEELKNYIKNKITRLNRESTSHNEPNVFSSNPFIEIYVFPKTDAEVNITFLNEHYSGWKLLQSFSSNVKNYNSDLIVKKTSDVVTKKFTNTHTFTLTNTKEISGELPIKMSFLNTKFNLKFSNTETTTDTMATETNIQSNPVEIMLKPLHGATVETDVMTRIKTNNYFLNFEIDPDFSWFQVIYGNPEGTGIPIKIKTKPFKKVVFISNSGATPFWEIYNLYQFIIDMENINVNNNYKRILNDGIIIKSNKIYINNFLMSEVSNEYSFNTRILNQEPISRKRREIFEGKNELKNITKWTDEFTNSINYEQHLAIDNKTNFVTNNITSL